MKVEVVLIGDETDTPEFFNDLCGMVEAIAERLGEPASVTATEDRVRRYLVSAGTAEHLASLSGLHRAQHVPLGASVPRILTSRVTLSVGGSLLDRTIRTYNYSLRFAVDHSTGSRVALFAALKGLA